MAVSGVGEAVAAPILGYWTNCSGKVVPPLMSSVGMSIVGNAIYMCLNQVPLVWRTCGLLLSRFLNGAGSGNRGTYFAYIAAASEAPDRARSMALSGGGALIGLNVGPAVQMMFTWIGDEGIDIGFMRLSMYTAPALLAILLYNMLRGSFFIEKSALILLFFLDDGLDRFSNPDTDSVSAYSIAAASDSDLERNVVHPIRLNILAVVVCMWTRAARMLITANIESTGSPFSEVMFGLDNEQVLNYNSLTQGAVGAFTAVMFFVYAFTGYSKWVSERMNCLCAMVALLVFHLLTFSWPFLPGELPTDCNKYGGVNGTQVWEWCWSLKPINFWLYYISYAVIFGIGLPCLNNSLQSLYSQVLGKGRQGTMQGVNQAVGCVSRILGPLLMSCAVYQRLVPSVEIKKRNITLNVDGVGNLAYANLSPNTQISMINDGKQSVSAT
uniref:MFS domain-containing protein n=1 Tax=Angiostrongylus cantonensis TaxID=6313 RepID=A0A0K0DQD7_ANGCA